MGLRAFCVVVDYLDLFRLTYSYNRHHFSEFHVITSDSDSATQDFCQANNIPCHVTGAFYANGAAFNKWLALEDGLDVFGRHGWICLMDADVLWPRDKVQLCLESEMSLGYVGIKPGEVPTNGFSIYQGQLCSPLRRMFDDVASLVCHQCEGQGRLEINPNYDCPNCFNSLLPGIIFPPEKDWIKCPIHRNVREWAGYSQIFHAEDPVLGPPPWHQVDWKHAGGADSFFQQKWHPSNKVRPPFEVLHLGNAGHNWHGRATPYLDGRVDPNARERLGQSMAIWDERRRRRRDGLDPFEPEKIK